MVIMFHLVFHEPSVYILDFLRWLKFRNCWQFLFALQVSEYIFRDLVIYLKFEIEFLIIEPNANPVIWPTCDIDSGSYDHLNGFAVYSLFD